LWLHLLSAQGQPIDLNGFFAIPPQNVTIAPDGSSAELQLGTVGLAALVHDPSFLGSPALIIPTVQESWLKFAYDFVEGPNNNDEFSAGVTDSLGEPLGPAFVFSTTDSSSGTVEFNLTQFVGEPFVGLAFILEALDADLGSSVRISDVRLQLIPEPSTVSMFALGASGLADRYFAAAAWKAQRPTAIEVAKVQQKPFETSSSKLTVSSHRWTAFREELRREAESNERPSRDAGATSRAFDDLTAENLRHDLVFSDELLDLLV